MTTISYIKLYGPPIYEAIKNLEKIATEMPEVCIMDTIIIGTPELASPPYDAGESNIFNYFRGVNNEIEVERCNNIISESGQKLGEHDFFFEWFTKPSMDQLNDLIKKVDKALEPLGCRYTIITKE